MSSNLHSDHIYFTIQLVLVISCIKLHFPQEVDGVDI